VNEIAVQDPQRQHTVSIVTDCCDGSNPWHMNTATQERRRCNIHQRPYSLQQCNETWLANDWHKQSTGIAEGCRFGRLGANHLLGNRGGSHRRTDISNGERNERSTPHSALPSACSRDSDWHDDRRGLHNQCRRTRNYEWPDK
jgi:hypothetical protein